MTIKGSPQSQNSVITYLSRDSTEDCEEFLVRGLIYTIDESSWRLLMIEM